MQLGLYFWFPPVLGPAEELPRKLEYMEFVCHAPDDYFKPKYPKISGFHGKQPEQGFIWTSVGPERCKVSTKEEIFGRLSSTDNN
jgi:hypothetical protein